MGAFKMRQAIKLIFAVFACVLLVASAQGQSDPPAKPVIEELYLARDNGEGRAGEQVSEFRTSDVPIYCVVLLETGQKVTVKMNFVAVAVSGVKPETKVVTASYTTKENQNRVNFTGTPDGRWTPGKYRVDIFLDGKPARNLEFEIRGASGTGRNNNTAEKFAPDPPKPPARRPKP